MADQSTASASAYEAAVGDGSSIHSGSMATATDAAEQDNGELLSISSAMG